MQGTHAASQLPALGPITSGAVLSDTQQKNWPDQREGQGARVLDYPTSTFKAEVRMSESDLISGILSGSSHLYDVLIQPYHHRVYRAALLHVKDEEDARDVAQESLLKAFLKLDTFEQRSQFSTWLTSITINEARNRLRRRSHLQMRSTGSRPESDGAEFVASVPDTRENPSQFVERQELSYLLEQAVNGLSSDYRKVFELRVIQNMSTGETAQLLKITSASVKARLHRARSSLQVSLRSTRGERRRSSPALRAELSVVQANRRKVSQD